mmetsp:Transcript_95217/g.308327  ORF Transcript_95217/g.308327 Transcript_95217/m.308327 type:complete len:306 (+) Transcript_95217:829-1746(+)
MPPTVREVKNVTWLSVATLDRITGWRVLLNAARIVPKTRPLVFGAAEEPTLHTLELREPALWMPVPRHAGALAAEAQNRPATKPGHGGQRPRIQVGAHGTDQRPLPIRLEERNRLLALCHRSGVVAQRPRRPDQRCLRAALGQQLGVAQRRGEAAVALHEGVLRPLQASVQPCGGPSSNDDGLSLQVLGFEALCAEIALSRKLALAGSTAGAHTDWAVASVVLSSLGTVVDGGPITAALHGTSCGRLVPSDDHKLNPALLHFGRQQIPHRSQTRFLGGTDRGAVASLGAKVCGVVAPGRHWAGQQ